MRMTKVRPFTNGEKPKLLKKGEKPKGRERKKGTGTLVNVVLIVLPRNMRLNMPLSVAKPRKNGEKPPKPKKGAKRWSGVSRPSMAGVSTESSLNSPAPTSAAPSMPTSE